MCHNVNKSLSMCSLLLAAWLVVAVAPVAHAQAFTSINPMTVPRTNHTATLLANGKVLLTGGVAPYDATAEIYDPSCRAFPTTGNMTAARSEHAATLLNSGKVLVTGGYPGGYPQFNPPPGSTAEVYDPGTGTFSATGSMITGRRGHTSTLLGDGTVLVAGGEPASAEIYDPATGTFSATIGSMGTARAYNTATLLGDGTVLVTGGIDNDHGAIVNSTAEIYDPVTRTFSATTGGMGTARFGHTATLLYNGTVLIAGGQVVTTTHVQTDTAEIYDPVTRTFSPTASMTRARYFHTATRLADGNVLVVGGRLGDFSSGESQAIAELYDPSTGTFSVPGSLVLGREYHTATLLLSGAVLVAGGHHNCCGLFLDSAELYGPVETMLSSLGPAQVWVGLKNSDDVGIRFDLRAEAYRGSTLVGSGEATSVSGGSSGFNNAKLDAIAMTPLPGVTFSSGDVLSFKLLVRNACTGSGKNSGTARLWFNDSAANSHFDAPICGAAISYLRAGSVLSTTAGAGPKSTIDVAAGAKCSAYKSFGTWSITLP